jgi:phosphocarrier protein HPr
MIEKAAMIRNGQGIHCRPSARIVTEATRYSGQIRVLSEAGEADLRSLLSLVSLGLQEGALVRVRVEGENEEAVCDQFVALMETHFDFPTLSPEGRDGMLGALIPD